MLGVCVCAQAADLSGMWLGTVTASGVELRLALHITKSDQGGFGGTMDSLDQNANGIPLANIKVEGDAVRFEVPLAGASFDGRLDAAEKEIAGTLHQGPANMALTFKRTNAIPVPVRPQEPKKPYPYDEVEAAYENTAQGVRLAGTLTVPREGKPVPAVLLISGSGPQNRDEELMGHKPFKLLADYLTRRGIVVLRVDDRGVGGSSGSLMKSTTLDFATDALAGVAYLKTRPEVDHARIGLLGHSEGAVIAQIAASGSKDVSFIVMLAGTAVPGEQVLYAQSEAILRARGLGEMMIASNREMQKRIFEALRAQKDDRAAAETIKTFAGEVEARRAANPWFRQFLELDPSAYLGKVTCPVLALNGEKDTQVLAKQNLPVIARTLEEAGNRDYAIIKLPRLNHLFQTANTGHPSEYAKIEETMAPVALESISHWILMHTNKGN
ncbi:MAG: alpha/beta fold hydrolase [Bryobacterales bacterium]|nr:alpha/beta fold hydrolase [Bryobacterales bacterium]